MHIRWGIVSVGRISHDFASILETLPEHKMIAVAARDRSDAQKFADEFNIPNAYGSYEDLAGNSEVDVVYVGTIHPQHARVCKLMLSGNKHVLCEKPFCMNAREAAEVINMAKEKHLFIMEGFWSRLFPAYQKLREHIDSGAIGEPRVVNATFGYATDLDQYPRFASRADGGGGLINLGCYPIQFAQYVFGEKPEKIVATGSLLSTGVDDTCSYTLHYSGGRIAVLTCSLTVKLHNRAFIQGTKGYIEIPYMWCPKEMIVNGETETFPLPECERAMNYEHSEGFVYEAEHVKECIQKGVLQSPAVSHAHTLEIAAILDEIRRQIGLVFDSDECI